MAQDDGGRPVTTPDQRDHLRKMTDELIRLARTKDHDAKVDLFLRLGEERVRELQEMHGRGKTSNHDALARSYERYLWKGACGAIENGAAKAGT